MQKLLKKKILKEHVHVVKASTVFEKYGMDLPKRIWIGFHNFFLVYFSIKMKKLRH